MTSCLSRIGDCGGAVCDLGETAQGHLETFLVKRQKCSDPLTKTILAIFVALVIGTLMFFTFGYIPMRQAIIALAVGGGGGLIALHLLFTLQHAQKQQNRLQSELL